MRNSGSGTAERSRRTGLMARLRDDRAGNTLAMMAAALVPLLGFVGSAVDTARMYMIKVRLQQACDAGALAGRKFMASSTSTTLDSNAVAQASTFFRNNFKTGTYGVNTVNFTPSKTSDNQVAGAATARVPMTLTSLLGFGATDITVTCEARFDVSDLDIMFVLDTTGSMAYTASDSSPYSGQAVNSYQRSDGTTGYYTVEKSNARIKALRTAVLNFYDTLAATADATTNIRYGFVPYSSTVNVGKIIPASYLLNGTYNYSTRVPIEKNSGSSTSTTYTSTNQSSCNTYAGRSPASGYNSSGQATVKTVSWTSGSGGTCVVTSQKVQLYYRFGSQPVDVSSFMQGGWVADPSRVDGSQSKWQGCIEERDTQALTSFSQSALPGDLNPDLAATNDATKWRPMWQDIVYARNNQAGPVDVISTTADTSNNYLNVASRASSGYVSCGKQAQRLATMTRQQVSDFLNDPDFRPMGGTYHDTGMIWGTRFLNPSGPFSADTAAWAGRNQPIRHIVFMTDGEMAPNVDIYGLYGYERYDKRVTAGDFNSLTDRHNARFLAECEAAKRRGITVWVIAFGEAMTAEEQQCASSSGNAFAATSDVQLNGAFQTIASRVAMLRISK